MSRYEVLTLDDSEKWNTYLERLPVDQQDIYYKPEYYKLYQDLGDGLARCFVFEDNGEIALYPFLINSVNELGYNLDKKYYDIQGAYGYNGSVSSSYDLDFISKFNCEFEIYCCIYNIIAEFTRFNPILGNQTFFRSQFGPFYDRETILIDLSRGIENIWNSQYSSKNRNVLRKAKKYNYEIEIVNDPCSEDLDTFYLLYSNTMKYVNAENFYFFSEKYFKDIFEQLKNSSYIANVYDPSRRIVCSAIFFHHKNYFHYHLSGRDVASDNSINNFLIDETVRFAIDCDANVFHLGGGRTSSDDDSLLKFKKSFSNNKIPFFIGKKIHNQVVYNEVVAQWSLNFPEKDEKYKNHLLKYRF